MIIDKVLNPSKGAFVRQGTHTDCSHYLELLIYHLYMSKKHMIDRLSGVERRELECFMSWNKDVDWYEGLMDLTMEEYVYRQTIISTITYIESYFRIVFEEIFNNSNFIKLFLGKTTAISSGNEILFDDFFAGNRKSIGDRIKKDGVTSGMQIGAEILGDKSKGIQPMISFQRKDTIELFLKIYPGLYNFVEKAGFFTMFDRIAKERHFLVHENKKVDMQLYDIDELAECIRNLISILYRIDARLFGTIFNK